MKFSIFLFLVIFTFRLYSEEYSISNFNINISEARTAFYSRDYRTAIKLYEDILEYSPIIRIEYFVDLAKSYIGLGDYNKAISTTRHGIRFNSVASWDIYYQQGYAFYKLGNYTMAIPAIENALSINEKSAYLHNFLGLMYFYLEDYTNAQDKFLVATTYNSQNPTFLCNLAASYEMQTNFRDALRIYERAAQFDSNNETSAQIEANRIRNYMATRNILPREASARDIGNISNTNRLDTLNTNSTANKNNNLE